MATLNGVAFENPLRTFDGSFGDPVTGPYAKDLQQQRFLPPEGEYWLNLPKLRRQWEPARVYGGSGLWGFAIIGCLPGETRRWDLAEAAWETRDPFTSSTQGR